MSFVFNLLDDNYYAEDAERFFGKFAELTFTDDEGHYVTKWFYPYRTNNGFSVSDNGLPHNNNVLECFIKDIRNDKDCKYYQDNEVIFEYKDNVFIIDTMTASTGCNLNIDMLLFRIYDRKEDVLNILGQLHNWLKGLQ
jgi:hypothetical protein